MISMCVYFTLGQVLNSPSTEELFGLLMRDFYRLSPNKQCQSTEVEFIGQLMIDFLSCG